MILTKGKYGNKVLIEDDDISEIITFCNKNDVTEIEVNSSKGSKVSSLKFLEKIKTSLVSIEINCTKIESIGSIQKLDKLKLISILSYSKAELDFSKFKELEECNLEWQNGYVSILKNKNIKDLYVNNLKLDFNVHTFGELKSLQRLTLLSSNLNDLKPIKSLYNLEYLRLGNCRNLLNIEDIVNLKSLKTLIIDTSKKIENINCIFSLKKIENLQLLNLGKINTIQGIDSLNNLKEFHFWESTNILDGDLLPLKKINSLMKVSFANRRHYNKKNEDFK